MNFKEIIKQEWEKEFPEAAELCTYENSLAIIYEQMIEKICVRVWNQAIDKASDTLYDYQTGTELEEAPLYAINKLKINEQGTNTTEI